MAENQSKTALVKGWEDRELTVANDRQADNFTYGANSGTSAADEAAKARATAAAAAAASTAAGASAAAAGHTSSSIQTLNANNAAGDVSAAGSVQGNRITDTGAHEGAVVSDYAKGAANTVTNNARAAGADLSAKADAFSDRARDVTDSAGAYQGRTGPQANFGQADAAQARAFGQADKLSALEATEGPSAAQAQLRSGLNQSAAQSLALARSGHGFGGSASALTQAAGQNAAASQNAVNASAQLRAQENAAYRQRAASNLVNAANVSTTVAGQNVGEAQTQAQLEAGQRSLNDAATLTTQGQGLDAEKAGIAAGQGAAAFKQSGLEAGANIGVQGVESGANITNDASKAGGNLVVQGAADAGNISVEGLNNAGNAALHGADTNVGATNAAGSFSMGGETQAGNIMSTDLSASENYAGLKNDEYQASEARDQADMDRGVKVVGGIVSSIGGMAAGLSDATAKTNIKDAEKGDRYDLDYSKKSGKDAAREDDDKAWKKAASTIGSGLEAYGASSSAAPAPYQQPPRGYQPAYGAPSPYAPPPPPQYGYQQPYQGYGVSDERTKEDKRPVHDRLRSALDDIDGMLAEMGPRKDLVRSGQEVAEGTHPYTYEYKDPARHGSGTRLGIMAQDLEKTLPGQTMVSEGPDGKKRVDIPQLAFASAAGVAGLNDRLDAIEAELDRMPRKKGKAA